MVCLIFDYTYDDNQQHQTSNCGCGKKFNNNSALAQHRQSAHGGGKASTNQSRCGESFPCHNELTWYTVFSQTPGKTSKSCASILKCKARKCKTVFTKPEKRVEHITRFHPDLFGTLSEGMSQENLRVTDHHSMQVDVDQSLLPHWPNVLYQAFPNMFTAIWFQ